MYQKDLQLCLRDSKLRLTANIEETLGEHGGSVVLLVNIPTHPTQPMQFGDLRYLHLLYADKGLKIIAVPCDDFNQSVSLHIDIVRRFCTNMFRLPFPIYEKVTCRQEQATPLMATLQCEQAGGPIRTAFEKFLIDHNGTLRARFPGNVVCHDASFTAQLQAMIRTRKHDAAF